MKSMKKTGKVILTSYYTRSINGALHKIITTSPRINVDVLGTPQTKHVKFSRKSARIIGCRGKDLRRKAIRVRGDKESLKKLIRLKIPDGVYIRLEQK
jgi:ribosomal protein S10